MRDTDRDIDKSYRKLVSQSQFVVINSNNFQSCFTVIEKQDKRKKEIEISFFAPIKIL